MIVSASSESVARDDVERTRLRGRSLPGKRPAGQALVGFDVLRAGLRDDVVGQRAAAGSSCPSSVVSSQSRTNCLSNDGCGPPGSIASPASIASCRA